MLHLLSPHFIKRIVMCKMKRIEEHTLCSLVHRKTSIVSRAHYIHSHTTRHILEFLFITYALHVEGDCPNVWQKFTTPSKFCYTIVA
jgi:hypothetical protein